jgi:hypothetical protein
MNDMGEISPREVRKIMFNMSRDNEGTFGLPDSRKNNLIPWRVRLLIAIIAMILAATAAGCAMDRPVDRTPAVPNIKPVHHIVRKPVKPPHSAVTPASKLAKEPPRPVTAPLSEAVPSLPSPPTINRPAGVP